MGSIQHSPIATPVSVIICAYTEQRWVELVKSLTAVSAQDPAPTEIILVIDHNPLLLERAQQAFENVRVIPNRETRGLSGARNSGVMAAKGEVLVFIDEDAWPEPGWLAQLLDAYEDLHILGVGGSIEPEWVSGRPTWFPEEFDWVVGCTYRGMPTTPSPVRNLIGANMSFRSSVFTAGGFNPGIGRVGSIPSGGEETELSIRVKQQFPSGLFLYIPEARVFHRIPPSRSQWAYFVSRCYTEGLSKALITRWVGARDGLGSERTYVFHTLPKGFLYRLGKAVQGNISELQQAFTLLAGLGITTTGYLVGMVRLMLTGRAFSKQYMHLEAFPQQQQGEASTPDQRIRSNNRHSVD